MITLNLKAIIEKTGKNISEIARDLGVNRNTVQSFASGKAGGIRFSTLEKMAKTFGLSVNELLVFQAEKNQKANLLPAKIYRQEAESVPFTMIHFFQFEAKTPALDTKHQSLFNYTYVFGRGQYFEAFLDEEAMRATALVMLKRLEQPEGFEQTWQELLVAGHGLEEMYKRIFDLDPGSLNAKQISIMSQEIFRLYETFWRAGIFVDALDTGVDQEETNRLANKYHFSKEEVGNLTTPVEKIFAQEKSFDFFKLVEKYSDKNLDTKKLSETLKNDRSFQNYRKNFDVFSSNYAVIKHITPEETAEEIIKTLANSNDWRELFFNLSLYEKKRRMVIKKILDQHHLSTNPLWLFERLTFFREVRKKYNLMGLHVLDFILQSSERLTGIPKKYLQHMLPDEVDLVLRGRMSLEELKRRRESNVLYVMSPDGNISLIYSKQAESIKKDLESRMGVNETVTTIIGQTACQGYAKGRARVILDISQFDCFHEGEILITGMTRPEFVPLMKKAAGIVTNEGGITCHAAVVSRELGVPCIIGTKVATKMIPDGATIEVRANHGTVRIIKD